MKAEKMREWDAAELKAKEHEFEERFFRLKFQLASGQTDTLSEIGKLRKDLARVKTLLRENERKAAEK
jgi:large subunit ribosomal protein L29